MLWACGVSLALWVVVPLRFLLLPLIFYNTHIHELCHALASWMTGGGVDYIRVLGDGSGVTLSSGGNAFLLASAGYVGSSLVGGIIIYGSRSAKSAKKMLLVAMGFLAFSMVFFVRGDAVGVATGLGWIVLLAACAQFLKGDAVVFFAQFLGVQQCLTSAQAFFALLVVSSSGSVHNDAAILEEATRVPAVVWAVAWMLFSSAAMGIGLKRSWSERPR